MNKRKKIVVGLILGIILVCNICGCQSNKEEKNSILRVGIVTYTQDDPFINALKEQLKGNLKTMETKDMKIMISERNGDNDQRDQNEAVEEMIDAGCDIMCINLVDRTEPSKIIKMARQNNIPVIFFNREPVKEDLKQWDKLYYVGCNAEQSGKMQGQIAAKYIKKNKKVDKNYDGKIQYVLLEGEAGHQDAISRTDCSVKTIIGTGIKLEKLSYQFADWNRGQAENKTNQLIEQYGDKIEMIISNNDEMALGALEAYKKSKYHKKQWPIIFGIDGLDDALTAIKNGEMQGTVYNDKEDQALEISRLVVDIYQGNSMKNHNLQLGKYYVSQYKKVEKSSIDKFIK